MLKKYPAFVGTGVAASVVAILLGYAQKMPCSHGGAWNSNVSQFKDLCYTDIYPLYYGEQLVNGKVPYYGHPVEYPVLMGAMMQAASWLVRTGPAFYNVSVAMLAVCLIAGVLATAAAVHREGAGAASRAALMMALSPGLILAAFINWDMFAMALAAVGMACWAYKRVWLAGIFLGLAVATKFYPLILFGALFLVCLRAGKLRDFGRAFLGGLIAWLVVNVPVALTATSGWAEFYAFSRSRGADWGSIWHLFENYKVPVVGNSTLSALNDMSSGSFAVACIVIAVVVLAAPRRPRLAQVCFLLLGSFMILNKVWSPQYVIWLLPLVVLSRPRIWAYVVWQVAEVVYFVGIWEYFVNMYASPSGITGGWYFVTLTARLLSLALLLGTVVYDMFQPAKDKVRRAGLDDPSGGVLDGAPDWLVIKGKRIVVLNGLDAGPSPEPEAESSAAPDSDPGTDQADATA